MVENLLKEINMKYNSQILKGQTGINIERNDATRVAPNKLKPKPKEPVINTTSEMINGKVNPNAHMGLDIVSPEFVLMTGGVGAGLLKGIPGAMVHGAAQGATWNAAGMGGEQSLSGLATDIAGGAIIGGAIKGSNPIIKKIISNTYKINPLAFKPKADYGYRMLGEEGLEDAIESGVLRAKQAPKSSSSNKINLERNTNRNPNTGKLQGSLDRPYFADGKIDPRYAADYMAEVNKVQNDLVPIDTHKGIAPSSAKNIPVENAKFYKKHWLQGYKEISPMQTKQTSWLELTPSQLKGEYYKRTFDPMKVNLQKYKGLVAPDEVIGIVDKLKIKHLQKKVDKIYTNTPQDSYAAIPLEDKIQTIKGQNKLKEISKAINSPTSQIGKPLGTGGFGSAYQFKYNPDYVVKFGRAAGVDRPLKLPELGKQFVNDPNVAIPLRVEEIAPGKYATIMKKVPGNSPNSSSNKLAGDVKLPRGAVAEAALKIRALNKKGIGFDYAGDNLLYDVPNKKFSIIDLNVLPDQYNSSDWFTKHINKVGQNPATVLKEKFNYRIEPKPKLKKAND